MVRVAAGTASRRPAGAYIGGMSGSSRERRRVAARAALCVALLCSVSLMSAAVAAASAVSSTAAHRSVAHRSVAHPSAEPNPGAASAARDAVRGGARRRRPPAPPITIPALDTVQIGPLRAGSGFNLYINAQGCGSADPYLQVIYRSARPPAVLSHTYSGFTANCTVVRRPGAARLIARLRGLLDVNVQIAKLGRPLRHPGLPAGCGAPFGPELPATATGRVDVSIHPKVFGSIAATTASAQIFSGSRQQCPAAQTNNGRQFTADVGSFILDAVQPTRGAAELDLLRQAGDAPAAGVTGTTELQVSGASGYVVTSPDGSATIANGAPFSTGALTFAALPACPEASAVNGNLGGTLTIADPLEGALTINGAAASRAYSGIGASRPGLCNGPGSAPVAPSVVTSCNLANENCSVSAGAASATFFDETSPGTQTITSELLDFGDGSAPVPVANYGSVRHTYASAGTYTATLTVSDATGATTTSTTPVYIDP